jgi:enediyne biosynthesis protein E4
VSSCVVGQRCMGGVHIVPFAGSCQSMIGQVRLVTILGVLVALGGAGSGCRKPTERPAPVPTDRTRQDRPSQTAEPPELQFSDLTEKAGVIFRHHSGAESGHLSILESLGSGVALLDYDGDGRLDLFFAGGGSFDEERILGKPSGLFRQVSDFQFQDASDPAGDGFRLRASHMAALSRTSTTTVSSISW